MRPSTKISSRWQRFNPRSASSRGAIPNAQSAPSPRRCFNPRSASSRGAIRSRKRSRRDSPRFNPRSASSRGAILHAIAFRREDLVSIRAPRLHAERCSESGLIWLAWLFQSALRVFTRSDTIERTEETVEIPFQSALRVFTRSDPVPGRGCNDGSSFQSALRVFTRSDGVRRAFEKSGHVSIRAPRLHAERSAAASWARARSSFNPRSASSRGAMAPRI